MDTEGPVPATGNRSSGQTEKFLRRAVTCVLLALLTSQCLQQPADPDLWGHLLFGMQSLEQGHIDRTDRYSYTAFGSPWVNHEWMSEVAFAVAYRSLGSTGLILMRAMLLTLAVVVLSWIVSRRQLGLGVTLILGLLGIVLLSQFYTIRPQMFTYTLIAATLGVCEHYRSGYRATLWLVPFLMVFWVNAHGGFVAGLGIFAIYWAEFLVSAAGRAIRHRDDDSATRDISMLICVGVLTATATLVNPYGLAYWRYIIHAVMLPRPMISEWLPAYKREAVFLFIYLVSVLFPAYLWFHSRRSGAWAETGCFFLTAVLAATHARHLPFLLMFSTLVTARRFPEFMEIHGPRLASSIPSAKVRGKLLTAGIFGVALLAVVACFQRAIDWSVAGPVPVSTAAYPVDAIRFMHRNQMQGNLMCRFDWGEYCIYQLYPKCRIFIDGRYETVYPPEIVRLGLPVPSTETQWERAASAFPTTLILQRPTPQLLRWARHSGRFAEVYRDATAVLLVSSTGPYAALATTEDSQLPALPPPQEHYVPFPG